MRILLLSAYDTLSHRRWREGLTQQRLIKSDEHTPGPGGART